MINRFFLVTGCVALALIVSGCQTTPESSNVSMTKPDQSVAPELAPLKQQKVASCSPPLPTSTQHATLGSSTTFAGRFVGHWLKNNGDNAMCSGILIPRQSTTGSTRFVYAYDRYRGWNINFPESHSLSGKVKGNVLKADFVGNNGIVKMTFTLSDDGQTLYGDYDGRAKGVFYRQ